MEIYRLLRGGEVPADQRETFQTYYREYEFGRWTQPGQLHELPARRRDLSNALKTAKTSPAHDELVALSLKFLGTLAGEAIRHPAARYNAMLAIGELNQREAEGSENPEPLPEALPLLLQAFTDANQIDAVRIAALLGLYRHAAINIADAQFRDNQLIPAMLAFVQSKAAAGRAPEGHAWMRARAIDVLGVLGQVGQDNAIPSTSVGHRSPMATRAFRSVVLLPELSAALRIRPTMAWTRGSCAQDWAKWPPTPVSPSLKRMDKEAEQEERKQKRPPRGMMDYGMEGMPPESADMMGGMPGRFWSAKGGRERRRDPRQPPPADDFLERCFLRTDRHEMVGMDGLGTPKQHRPAHHGSRQPGRRGTAGGPDHRRGRAPQAV